MAATKELRSPTTMSFEEFMDLRLPEGMRAEWEDGEVIFIMPSNLPHQLLLLFLSKIFDEYVRGKVSALLCPAILSPSLPVQAGYPMWSLLPATAWTVS